jgi:hypothetical protein
MLTTVMKPKTGADLQNNILATYFTMRGGLVLFSISFPIVLLGYSLLTHHGTLSETSISAYYGADGAAMRNYFVATLCVIGALLGVYKGFSLLENVLLKVAGASVALVAFFPCNCWSDYSGTNVSRYVHDTVAVVFFASMILVVELCAMDTITLLETKALQKRFRYAYHTLAASLFFAAAGSIVVNYIARLPPKSIFIPETFGIVIFAVYWFVKSREFHHTAAEKKAARGEITAVGGKLVDLTSPALAQGAALQGGSDQVGRR